MKKIKLYAAMLFVAAIGITGCQTDSVTEISEESSKTGIEKSNETTTESNITVVTHNYDYYGERFSVNYTYDNDSGEVLQTDGDTQRAEQLFSEPDSGPQAILYGELEDRGEGAAEPQDNNVTAITIEIQLFDTTEDMEAEVVRDGGDIPQEDGDGFVNGAEGPCSSLDYWGYGDFYYYKHSYYNSLMSPVSRFDRRYYRDHYVGASYNDQMSSIIVIKPYYYRSLTYLYQHSCFNGRVLGFYQGAYSYGYGVANLKWYTMYGWWFWRTSWNDQVSSTRGWVY